MTFRSGALGANLGATRVNDFRRQTDVSGQVAGDHASMRTDLDDAERLTGIYGSDALRAYGESRSGWQYDSTGQHEAQLINGDWSSGLGSAKTDSTSKFVWNDGPMAGSPPVPGDEPEAGKVTASKARQALAALGVRRKGRSRTWLGDQSWQGKQDQAGESFRKAADAGDTDAMVKLGYLLMGWGEQNEAEQWFRKAADLGNTSAMGSLGFLLAERGEHAQAEQWHRKAADAGDTIAMVNLGVLLRGRGEQDQAEQWYRKAAGAGDTGAMHNLGNLLTEQGKRDQAEQWYRKAADAGHRDQ